MSNRLKTLGIFALNMIKGGLIVGAGYAATAYFDLSTTAVLIVAMLAGYAYFDLRIDDLSAEVDYLRGQLPEREYEPMDGWPPTD